eukprot:GSMAST32.ASY1.ANO1.1368.1 assembled CDS
MMVPIYSVQALLSMLMPALSPFLNTVRDIYEAYVIYMFFTLLIAYLGGEDCLIDYLELKSYMRHPSPFRKCFDNIVLGRHFLQKVKEGTLQFVCVRPMTGLLAFFLQWLGLYSKEDWSLTNGHFWLSLVNNISISLSLYSLVLFYRATEIRLKPFRPLSKFIVIKSVVFFSYWQGLLLSILVQCGFITDDTILDSV